MDALDGIGTGLIAGGALSLILALTEPEPPLPGVPTYDASPAESARRYRNARAGTLVGALGTFLGSVLLLAGSSGWTTSAPTAVFVFALTWVMLTRAVRTSYQRVVEAMETQMSSAKGAAIRQSVAAYVGAGHLPGGGFFVAEPGSPSDGPVSDPEAVLAEARRRATWRFALTHPLGARHDGL